MKEQERIERAKQREHEQKSKPKKAEHVMKIYDEDDDEFIAAQIKLID